MAPALLVYSVFVIYPLFQSVSYSVFDWSGPGRPATDVGLENFERVFRDPIFYRALLNNFVVVIVSLVVQLPVGMALALVITSPVKAKRFFRAVYFLPFLMSTVAVGLLWGFIYNPSYGLINSTLRAVGLDALAQGWLGQSSTALGAVMVTTVWAYAPFYMIIYSAAISALPAEIYEAAAMDGANKVQQFFRLTLPMLRPAIITTAVLSLIGSIKYFDLVYVMTGGGPSGATELLATYVFKQGFTNREFGYASALAVVLLLISLVLTAVVLARARAAAKKEDNV
jgi:raffinose/stachyose/melibiose transport system permease protein